MARCSNAVTTGRRIAAAATAANHNVWGKRSGIRLSTYLGRYCNKICPSAGRNDLNTNARIQYYRAFAFSKRILLVRAAWALFFGSAIQSSSMLFALVVAEPDLEDRECL